MMQKIANLKNYLCGNESVVKIEHLYQKIAYN